MRYVGKIWVMDVMDQIVVSGYVHDCPPPGSPAPDPFEFAWQIPGLGLGEPAEWLQDALKRALPRETPASSRVG